MNNIRQKTHDLMIRLIRRMENEGIKLVYGNPARQLHLCCDTFFIVAVMVLPILFEGYGTKLLNSENDDLY